MRKNSSGYVYVCVENDGGRGAQHTESVLKNDINEHSPRDVETLILWSDLCGGQSELSKCVLLMQYAQHTSIPEIKYL